MLTSYDYSMAKIVDAAGVDVILVGDSAANVMAGYETTLPITLDMMIYHARSVVRAVSRALVVVDLPFGTYQGNSKVALDSAVRIMKETEADAVKMEGRRGDPRIGPAHPFGGYSRHGAPRTDAPVDPQVRHLYGARQGGGRGRKLVRDAHLLSDAGCFSIVLEKIPAALAPALRGRSRRRRSASGPAGRATARCWSSTTCWVSTRASHRASCAGMPTCIR